MPNRKQNYGTSNGVSRAMRGAFSPDSPVDPKLKALIREVDGKYLPDEVADRRATQLLKRLQDLPWGKPEIIL